MGATTDPVKAAQAMNLGDAGYPTTQVAQMTGLAQRTAYDVIHRLGHWGQVADKPVFAKLRQEQNQHLEAAARALAAKAFIQAEEALPKASFYQAVVGGSILIDKARLLAGESTENISVHHVHEVQGLDKLCSLLGQSLMESTPVLTEENKVK